MRILARLAPGGEAADALSTSHLCGVCAEVVEVAGAGIMLMSGDVQQGSLCATDSVSAQIEDLQFALGEGPCVDAYRRDSPVGEPDLARPVSPRWPAFSSAALDAGVGAVFAFPLQVGSARLGALDLYNRHAGPLSDEQHADALVMANVAAELVLLIHAQAPPGRIAAELTAGADFHYGVHQAAGMVAAQLDITVTQALIRLRAHAFGNDRALADVAYDVVERHLRFDTPSERDALDP